MLESLPVDSNAMELAVARWRGFIELGEVGGEDIAAEVIGGDFFNAGDAGLVCQVVTCQGSIVLARNFAVHR